MRPSKWRTCTIPAKMLGALGERASPRRLRLFACACAREVAHLLQDEESRAAVLAAERFADGLATDADLRAARQTAETVAALAWSLWDEGTPQAQEAASVTAREDPLDAALRAAEYAAAAAQAEAGEAAGWKAQQRRQCDLLRDIFGNPFAGEVVKALRLLRHVDAVRNVAGSIYEEGRWEDLPVLGDALEDADCADRAVLDHLRGPGPHARGCWALDLLLDYV